MGWISEQFGPRYGLAVGGVATVVAAGVMGWVLLRRRFTVRSGSLGVAVDAATEPVAA